MKTITLFFGAFYGMLSVILGAFGAHAFKKILSVERLESFEVGVKYQMYAALYLLIIGFFLKFDTGIEKKCRLVNDCRNILVLSKHLFSFFSGSLEYQSEIFWDQLHLLVGY